MEQTSILVHQLELWKGLQSELPLKDAGFRYINKWNKRLEVAVVKNSFSRGLMRGAVARIICRTRLEAGIAMQNTDRLSEKLKQLADEQQHEVADFVDFLLSRIPDTLDLDPVLRETAGIWKGEAEGTAYEDALREQWKQRG